MIKHPHFPFWLITIAIFIGLIIPILIQDGMFMDGQQYACVSKNLANGQGSFWFPHLSDTWWKANDSHFMEHPPLVYGMQAIFFNLLGNSIYTERLYSLLTAIISALLIFIIWKQIFKKNTELKALGWIPILLWIIMPVCSWSYQNNLMENSMGVFTLLSVLFSIRGLENKKHNLLNFVLAGIFIFLAFMSKGIPGLFPLICVLLYAISFQNIKLKKVLLYTGILISSTAICFLITLQFENARESISFYITERLLHRINNEPTISSHFHILKKLLLELAIPAIIVTIALAVKRFKQISFKENKNAIIFFSLVGISASLPLMFTPVQRGFYLLPSLPFFAIALGMLLIKPIKDYLLFLESKKTHRLILNIFGISLLCLSLTLSIINIGGTSRDTDMLHDVYILGENIPANTTVSIPEELFSQWNLQMYMIRYFNISLDASEKHHQLMLYPRDITNDLTNNNKEIELGLRDYRLFTLEN